MALRWIDLLVALTPGSRPPFPRVLRIFFVSSFVSNFVPSVAADLYRAYALARHDVQLAESTASVLMDRVLGVLSMVIVGACALPFAESLVRGLLLAADHSHRAALEGEVIEIPSRAIREAIEIIEAEADRPWTVSALAERSHVSVRSLQQAFQRHLGTSPMAYLRVYFYCLAQGLVMGLQRYPHGIWGGLPAPCRPFDIGGQERGNAHGTSSSCSSSARTPSICSSAYAVIAALVMLAPVLARAS